MLAARHMLDLTPPSGLVGFVSRTFQPELDNERMQLGLDSSIPIAV
jgi:hypothetical protein